MCLAPNSPRLRVAAESTTFVQSGEHQRATASSRCAHWPVVVSPSCALVGQATPACSAKDAKCCLSGNSAPKPKEATTGIVQRHKRPRQQRRRLLQTSVTTSTSTLAGDAGTDDGTGTGTGGGPDGATVRLFSAAYDGTVMRWDPASQTNAESHLDRAQYTTAGFTGGMLSGMTKGQELAASPDGKRLYVCARVRELPHTHAPFA